MSNGLKLAVGWVVTVFVALAFSWGAIAQVRDRVDQPATVIPTSIIASASGSSGDTADTTTTILVINVEPEVVSGDEAAFDATTTTAPAGGDETSVTAGAVDSPTSTAGSATLSSSPTTSTTRPSSSGSSGTTPTTATTSTTAPSSSGTSATTTPTTTTSTTTSHTMPPTTSSTTSTSTSTTSAPTTQTSSYSLTGGTVTIKYSPGVVNLVGASPNNGFWTNVEKAGPSEVRVNFENDTHESEFTAKWDDGELKIIKKENADGGDDGD